MFVYLSCCHLAYGNKDRCRRRRAGILRFVSCRRVMKYAYKEPRELLCPGPPFRNETGELVHLHRHVNVLPP